MQPHMTVVQLFFKIKTNSSQSAIFDLHFDSVTEVVDMWLVLSLGCGSLPELWVTKGCLLMSDHI